MVYLAAALLLGAVPMAQVRQAWAAIRERVAPAPADSIDPGDDAMQP
jgi:hypothetical protein